MNRVFPYVGIRQSHTEGMLTALGCPVSLSADYKIVSFHKQFSDAVRVKTQ